MALIDCPECGASISTTSTKCPQCGAKWQYLTKPEHGLSGRAKQNLIAIAIVIAVVALVLILAPGLLLDR